SRECQHEGVLHRLGIEVAELAPDRNLRPHAGGVDLELYRGAQRPRETELVAIGVDEMKVALSPFGISGHSRGLAPSRQRTVIKCINVGHVEDDASPAGPALFIGPGNQVEIAHPGPKSGK